MRRKRKQQLIDLAITIEETLNQWEQLEEKEQLLSQMVQGVSMIAQMLREEKEGEMLCPLFEQIRGQLKSVTCGQIRSDSSLLQSIENHLKNGIESLENIEEHIAIVFLPYKVQMWGVFQTIYEEAVADPTCQVTVVPIPYYSIKENGVKEFHYEGELFHDIVPITHYNKYQVEQEEPDIVYVHNIYDDFNTLTQVEKTYFTSHLKQYTRQLVYVPYFVSSFLVHTQAEPEFWFHLPSLQNVDKIVLAGSYLEQPAIDYGIPKEKLLSLGSPKLDTIVRALQGDSNIPVEWEKRLGNKKVLFINTLYHVFEHWDTLTQLLSLTKEDPELAIIWRPHPLTENFLEQKLPQYVEAYRDVKRIIRLGKEYPSVVLDETKDYLCALKRADVMVSGVSSLLNAFLLTKRPVLFLGELPKSSILPKETFYYVPKEKEQLQKVLHTMLYEETREKEQLREKAFEIYANCDGTCGKKVHRELMNILQLENYREDAILSFECGKYREAFLMWMEIYNHSVDQEERETIYQIVKEAYYLPNEEDIQNMYEHNYQMLQNYPFVLGVQYKNWEQLEMEIYPISDNEICVYHKGEQRFYGPYCDAKENVPYCFNNLDNPLLLEEVFTYSYLQFLQDNVRKSEDFGGDNHIYLTYDNEDWFSVLLQWFDLSTLLQDKKFVFLVGDNAKVQYPINFKEQFGIEYREEDKKPIQIEEMKRICYWYKYPYSGNDLGIELLGTSSYVHTIKGQDFHLYSKKDGIILGEHDGFREVLKKPQYTFTFQQLKEFRKENGYELYFEEYFSFIDWLEIRLKTTEATVLELFKGYFLYNYEKREKNPRIVPMILWDLHLTENNLYEEIVKEFPYLVVLTSMRDPVVVLARSYDFGLIGWNEFQTKYFLASSYVHTQFLSEELEKYYYGYRFEDLKKYPKQTLYSICSQLNIPLEKDMLEVKVPVKQKNGEVVEGFDLAPLRRNITKELSDFDQMRLKIYYEPILKYYGYDSFDLEEYPMSEGEVVQLLKYPFRFERLNKEKFGIMAPKEEELRRWIEEIMIQTYHGYRQGQKIRFPKIIRPNWEVE